MNRRVFLVFCVCLALATGLSVPPVAGQSPAGEIIRLVNELRAAHGLPPFTPNASLMAAAQGHADWMAANMSYTHTGAGGSRPQDRATAAGYRGYVSENIVGGTNLSPQQGVIWWENSAIHYQTMTSTRHTEVGAGFAANSAQNMYVLVVGAPSDYAPARGSSTSGGQNTAQEDAPLVVIPVTRSEPREDGSIVHTVQIGQTAWDIAAVYDVDLATLLRLNNLPDDPILLPGDEIMVKPPDGYELTPQGPLTHRVQEGQTAWAIAARYGISLQDLLWLNGLNEQSVLQPGDELIIRLAEGQQPPPTPTPPTTHIVQSGETLWGIAINYGLSLDDLLALNGITADTVLQPGDELIIHAAGPTPTVSLPPPETALAALPQDAPPTAAATMTALLAPPTATFTPGPTATHAILPTLTPLPDLPATGVDKRLIGALVIGLGVLALLGMAGIEIIERLTTRR